MDQSSLRNLFEVNNARTQSIDEVVNTFVPTDSFWRLVNGKNHVVLGSRGSGKTAVLKMLAHDHLSRFTHPTAEKLIQERRFVGTFVPMRADWIGTLKNKPWYGADDSQRSFQWRLNLSCCVAFVDTVESCLKAYCSGSERAFAERDLALFLQDAWTPNATKITSLRQLRAILEDVEWQMQVNSLSGTAPVRFGPDNPNDSAVFGLDLFSPINRGIQILKRVIKFPDDAIWSLSLDELEFLDEQHHELINTFLRGKSNLAFKLSTMPYFHHTLRTKTSQPIAAGNDFDYVYLDNDPSIRRTDRSGWTQWANDVLCQKVGFVEKLETDFSLSRLLGDESPLLDDKPSGWLQDSSMMGLLHKHANPKTIERATRLPAAAFKDQISRKMHSMLLLRETVGKTVGNRKHGLYSGPKLFALCSDANPRQLIRLFNELTLNRRDNSTLKIGKSVHPNVQTQCVINFSSDALQNASTEEGVGGELYSFLKSILEHFQWKFFHQPLSTDYYYAVKTPPNISAETWNLIKYAVGLGLMFPKTTFNQPDLLPEQSNSEFDIAFRLAPKYGLLPRKGKSVPLATATSRDKPKKNSPSHHIHQFELL